MQPQRWRSTTKRAPEHSDPRTVYTLTTSGRSPREQALYLSSFPFAVAPIAAALYYAFTHASDLRYLPIAFGTFAGVSLVMLGARARARPRKNLPLLLILSAAMGAILGAVAALWLVESPWALTSAALWATCLFALSWAVSQVFDILSQPRADPSAGT